MSSKVVRVTISLDPAVLKEAKGNAQLAGRNFSNYAAFALTRLNQQVRKSKAAKEGKA
jgi:hypothetical protein